MRKRTLNTGLLLNGLAALAFAACSAHSAPTTPPEAIRVVQRNAEGMAHLALPTHLDGCDFVGRVRVSQPAGCTAGCDLVAALKVKASRQGGDTLVVLPGGQMVVGSSGQAEFRAEPRIVDGSLRGTVFRCR